MKTINSIKTCHCALILPCLTCVAIITNELKSGDDKLIKLRFPFGDLALDNAVDPVKRKLQQRMGREDEGWRRYSKGRALL